MPRPVMRTLLPFLRCFTTRPTKSSRAPVASFLVMPVFSASSAATLESGMVGTEGLEVGIAMVGGPFTFFRFANVVLTPQGSVGAHKVNHESQARKRLIGPKCRFLGLFWPSDRLIHRLGRP